MRRLLVALVAIFLVLSAKVITEDEIVYFPDPYFKDVLVNMEHYQQPLIDLNRDGEIQYSEAEAYAGTLWLTFRKDSITDLTGIKSFINAKRLWLDNCLGIKSLDLSGMVNLLEVRVINNPKLSTMNVSGCISLKELDFSNNKINDLIITNCKSLNAIWPYKNSLIEINLNDCPQIQYLFAGYNKLTNIDVSQATDLRRLQIQENILTIIDVSCLTKLDKLWVSDNKLTNLNIRNNNNKLLTSFQATNNPDLKCITVDDPAWSKENWKAVDEWTGFSEDCSTSINNNQQNSFKVYPNPANNTVIIDRVDLESADLRILDITGRIYVGYTIPFGEAQTKLDVSMLPAGKYILEINNVIKSLIID
ncbi:MAG: T9SS type A sorting domain-containing protein [bacterium]